MSEGKRTKCGCCGNDIHINQFAGVAKTEKGIEFFCDNIVCLVQLAKFIKPMGNADERIQNAKEKFEATKEFLKNEGVTGMSLDVAPGAKPEEIAEGFIKCVASIKNAKPLARFTKEEFKDKI